MYMKPTAPPSIEDDGEDAKRSLGEVETLRTLRRSEHDEARIPLKNVVFDKPNYGRTRFSSAGGSADNASHRTSVVGDGNNNKCHYLLYFLFSIAV